MECVMDLPCFGEAELICDGGEDFDDCEESFTFWCEFGVRNRSLQVSGFEPDFVSFGERSETSVIT